MIRTFSSLTIFFFIVFSNLHAEEVQYSESIELSSLEDSNPNIEISSLGKEISDSEASSTISTQIETAAPELSTKISTLQDDSNTPMFSSLEENSPIHFSESPSLEIDTQTIADPFSEEADVLEENLLATSTQKGIEINLIQVFSASPFIYCLLLALSLSSIAIWLYSMSRLKSQGNISESFKADILNKLHERRFQEALDLCKGKQSLLTQIMASGLSWHKHGLHTMLENMKSEGKRSTVSSWQRLGLLQDIAIIAPMLGLLGTVLGMFYAFYDLNRSFESVANLFDGFGIAVGTTVAGIGVAILAMILHSIIKFRLVQSLALIENEATALVRVLDENN